MNSHFRQGIKNIPEICVRHGVQKAVISPGSRNAPLILAFTVHPDIECFSIIDERSAAYFAIGLAQATTKPVVLICTSGTAVLNFAPALAEAYYRALPLVVFTADRPAELIDQADGQAIRQIGVFANYVKASFSLPPETEKDTDLQFSDRQVSQAIDTANTFPCAPVHVNVPLREPLYVTLPEFHSNPKIIKTTSVTVALTPESAAALKDIWLRHKRKMIIFGIFPRNSELSRLAAQFAQDTDTVVIAENLSNISGKNIIAQPEVLFAGINSLPAEERKLFAPDLLVTAGDSVISRQLKSFLRANRPAEQIQIETAMPYIDTYGSLTLIVKTPVCNALSIMPHARGESTFAKIYAEKMKNVLSLHINFINRQPKISDMYVVDKLLKQLPENTVLHLANSTSVRLAQLFSTRADVIYFCNRGVSGIDGSFSTAVGYACLSRQLNVFLTGDLSFIYDSNAMWNRHISSNLKIIVMNNNGGNIFRNIANRETIAGSEHFFTTPHNVQIRHLAAAFGIDYICCNAQSKLGNKIAEVLNSDKCTILEIRTDGQTTNTQQYSEYFDEIKKHFTRN